ncbi:hypothetical protein IE53DRAFT_390402 [Violaceomyces palustris]|uniref:Uncharacterized protein n=1 Tax=Violaceomyces palustris TaxID=1673888 RepID=A0ACD0NNR5_9BASI|nr:hypothetical protein IE53DRAFT_390402 [Violaceomyces palustris]
MASQDPYVKKASEKAHGLSPQQRIEGAMEIVEKVGTGMLTTRSPDGKLASRAMKPATTDGLVFSFFFNKDSGKMDDVEVDPQVNVSYHDAKTTDWVSISGTAKVNDDREKVKKHWSSSLKAWFDDRKDGKHTGDENDPRVALMDVYPSEIRYFKADGKLKYLAETAKAAVSGGVASPGKLVVITSDEIQLASRVHSAA